MRGLQMLLAIRFHDDAAFEAREVRDERADRVLAAELVAAKPAVAQACP